VEEEEASGASRARLLLLASRRARADRGARARRAVRMVLVYRYGLNLRRYLLLFIVLFWTVLAFATADWETTFIAYVSDRGARGREGGRDD
jgi:hypothetical protein